MIYTFITYFSQKYFDCKEIIYLGMFVNKAYSLLYVIRIRSMYVHIFLNVWPWLVIATYFWIYNFYCIWKLRSIRSAKRNERGCVFIVYHIDTLFR